jgi:hypothetical protein
MAFSPISLPIQEILLTNFVVDIATISNANDIILQDKIEDLLNNFEIDLNTLSIGTDNPINYVKARSFIIEDTGFIFQTGTPSQIIARLEKNSSLESVLTVDRLNVNLSADLENISVNSATINDSILVDGPAEINNSFKFNAASIESKETVITDLVKNGSDAESRITLTSSSRKNIFVKLSATTAPNLNFVYDGVSALDPTINLLTLYIDFDANNPPAQNTVFNIYLVDIVDEFTSTSIYPAVISGLVPFVIRGGINLNATPNVPVILHNGLGSSTYDVGINPNSSGPTLGASQILKSNVPSQHGHSISLIYILDDSTNDRLLINGMVGMEFFIP